MMNRIFLLSALTALFVACSEDSVSGNDDSSGEKLESSSSVEESSSSLVKSSSSAKKAQSSSSEKSSKSSSSEKSKSSSSSKTNSSSSGKTTATSSSQNVQSSSSAGLLSSSSVPQSSSSVFVCSQKWPCSILTEECDASKIGNTTFYPDGNKKFYYVCDSTGWVEATYVEYDVSGRKCKADGDTLWGHVDNYLHTDSLNPYRDLYVCRNGELYKDNSKRYFSKECNAARENEELEKKYVTYVCKGGYWNRKSQHTGTMTDSRDGREYRTVGIGDHLWMQEDLQYKENTLYSWYTATGNGSNNGEISAMIRGVCPEGWHLPTYWDRQELSAYGGYDECLVGKTGWSADSIRYFKGTDCLNMEFLPRDISKLKSKDEGHVTGMWYAEASSSYAYALIIENAIYSDGASVSFSTYASRSKSDRLVVRCVMEEPGDRSYKSTSEAPYYEKSR